MKNLVKLVCAVLLVVASGAAQASGDLSPADNKALHDYTLSMDKVKAMQAAMDDYKAAVAKDPSLKDQTKDIGNEAQSIAQMEARFQANTRLMTIYSRRGITAADAVLMPLTLMSASVAAQYPAAAAKLTAQTSLQQIDFVKVHSAELKKMAWLYGSSE
jgi:hypothetical protein